MLLARCIDAGMAIEEGLHRLQGRREKRALAIEDARHVAAERLHQRDHDGAKEQDLNPADEGHGGAPLQNCSGRSRA